MNKMIDYDISRLNRSRPIYAFEHHEDSPPSPHSHRFHELVVVLGGRGEHVTDTERYGLEAGDAFVITPGHSHHYEDVSGLVIYNILYYKEYLPFALFEEGLPGYQAFFELEPAMRAAHGFSSHLRLGVERLEKVVELVEGIRREEAAQQPGYWPMVVAKFLELVVHLSRQYALGDSPKSRELVNLDALLTHMRKRCERPLTLDGLAERAGMSKSSLNRLFLKAVGKSPVDRLIEFRVERAKTLLEDMSLNISEVASRCGFEDSNYFSRRFRHATGVSPRTYREKLR